MTQLFQVIKDANEMRGNTVPDETKARWVYELESELYEMTDEEAPENPYPGDGELLIDMPPHNRVYALHLCCMIDLANQDMALYASDNALFNDALSKAKAWYRRGHRRVQPYGGWVGL